MASNVVIHEDAQLEILNALEYYRKISEDLSQDLSALSDLQSESFIYMEFKS